MSNFLKYLFDNFPHTLRWNFNRAGFKSAFTEQGIKKVKGFVFTVNPMAFFNITVDFGAFEVELDPEDVPPTITRALTTCDRLESVEVTWC